MRSSLEIAQAAKLRPIAAVAEEAGLLPSEIEPHGAHVAKVEPSALKRLAGRARGKLVVVTAITPTPQGEGKTTTAIGLVDALRRLGTSAMATLRQPSLGPVFGLKGGASGGGRSQVVPTETLNLHLTGDLHPGLDPVELAARDERDRGRVPVSAVIASAEEPVVGAHLLAAEFELAQVVVQPQQAVVEEAGEGDLVVDDVVHRLGDGRLVVDLGPLGSEPRVELVDNRLGLGLPLDAVGHPGLRIGGEQVRVVQEADEADDDERARFVAGECLEGTSPGMAPTPTFGDGRLAPVEFMVDG